MIHNNGGFDSGCEKRVWAFCERNDIPISRGPIFDCEYQGKAYRTHAYFKPDGKLFEVKGHTSSGQFSAPGARPALRSSRCTARTL